MSDEEDRLNHDLLPTSQQLSWSDRRSRSADEVGAAVVNSLARGDWDRLLLGAGMDQSALLEMRRALVHDPAEQQRADDAAEIETGGDDAESAPGRAGRRRVAHQHVARGRDHAPSTTGRRTARARVD